MYELHECRKVFGNRYIRLSAFDATPRLGVGAAVVHRQPAGGGAGLRRWSGTRRAGRNVQYTLRPYATERPIGERY